MYYSYAYYKVNNIHDIYNVCVRKGQYIALKYLSMNRQI